MVQDVFDTLFYLVAAGVLEAGGYFTIALHTFVPVWEGLQAFFEGAHFSLEFFEMGECGFHFLPEGTVCLEVRFLRQVGYAVTTGNVDFAFIAGDESADDFEQGAFAGTVDADDGYFFAMRDLEAYLVQDQVGSVIHGQVVDGQKGHMFVGTCSFLSPMFGDDTGITLTLHAFMVACCQDYAIASFVSSFRQTVTALAAATNKSRTASYEWVLCVVAASLQQRTKPQWVSPVGV